MSFEDLHLRKVLQQNSTTKMKSFDCAPRQKAVPALRRAAAAVATVVLTVFNFYPSIVFAQPTKTLSGGVETTAIMPANWTGLWKGQVQMQALQGQTSLFKTSTADLTLDLSASKNGKTDVKQLLVSNVREDKTSLSAGANADDQDENKLKKMNGGGDDDGDPDIIFQHDGNHSTMVIKNGAHVHVHGSMLAGVEPGSSASIYVGGSPPDLSNTDGIDGGRTTVRTGGGAIDYNQGGIVFGGPTEFEGRHFRSDAAIDVAHNAATIRAGRIDIAGHTVHPGGTVVLEGDRHAGYMINDLGSAGPIDVSTLPLIANGAVAVTAATAPPAGAVQYQLLGSSQKLLKNALQAINANTIGQQTMIPLLDASGKISGYQQTSMRYTAVAPDRMLVQIGVNNYSPSYKLTKQFEISGYIDRVQTAN
jgi:hypothetical protein